jgi:glycerate dehydrogenase
MRIVILDGYTLSQGRNVWESIASQGDLAVHDRTSPAEVVDRARNAEVVLTNKAPLGQETLGRLPALRYVAVIATGYNCVDVDAARRRGIPVSNVPEYGTDSVAQLTFALLLELCHHVGDHDRAVREGAWSMSPDWCFWRHPLVELSGLRMGIVGFGRIGRRVGEIAHVFGMEVLAASRSRQAAPSYDGFSWRSIPEIFEESDVVSLHCPETPETRGFVTSSLLGRMKKTAWLLNTSRGSLIDERSLATALDERILAGAALDVVAQEPIRPDNPLLNARNCILTPHLAWATEAARRRLIDETARNLTAFREGRPRNVVNAAR